MDAPNAPTPANPKAQYQNVDAEPGPEFQAQGSTGQNQAQGPVVQNPAQGPADQNQGQVPAGQVLAQGPTQVVQNIPLQPLQQPVPMEMAPAGIIMPAPQMFYQNWRGKKPEFSGKPEEDAESHLLSTRGWMEVHNFPEGEKVMFHVEVVYFNLYIKCLPS